MRVIRTSPTGIELIEGFEKLWITAYLCPAGVPTIGFGTTRYPNGVKVKMGDRCSYNNAVEYLQYDLRRIETAVDNMTRDDIRQNQFDALVSFCYNLGEGALRGSTLLRLVNDKKTLPDAITAEFLKWDNMHVNGKLVTNVPGLTRRRKVEAYLYNNNELNFPKP